MISFDFLQKERAGEVLPSLFDILHTNMAPIAPDKKTYDESFREWMDAVAPALEKEARQIILIHDDGRVVGFFQYYVNDTIFMMEEIQFLPEYQGKGVFQKLYAHLSGVVPTDIQTVEAYANKWNTRSQKILNHLGLEVIEDKGSLLHFRGDCRVMLERYIKMFIL